MPAIQRHRLITVTTPLGADALLFHRMTGKEALSSLYKYKVDFLSENNNIVFDDMLGQNICVNLRLANNRTRHFNGFVSRFSQRGTRGEYHCYRAIVRPWLWFLTRTTNCRIFQEMTVPDIVKQVCNDQGFSDIEVHLTGSYRTWVYCVQYRETDFNFVSRLLEQEGIYYYFKHEQDKHLLVLCDSISAHESIGEIPYYPQDNVERRETDHIYKLSLGQQVQTGWYTQNAYDFTQPKANLLVKAMAPRDHAYSNFEQFGYPGQYIDANEGDNDASHQIEALQSRFERVKGGGNVRECRSGSLFQLTYYPRQDQNREYLVISTDYQLQSDQYFSTSGTPDGDDCRCTFQAIDSGQPFRAQRTTPKPVVEGPQTAIVVGPAGEEIYTDKYGRVKVQFHWDRAGKMDENSSCWIRVSQVHAGKSFGGIDLPRIGEEVIVDFLEGDPDQPIITGRVYNNYTKPPYKLPANKSISGLKSNATKGGLGFNEIRFEDKKGAEQVFIQAEKNQDIRVKNDHFEFIGNERHLIVKSDQLEQVEGDKHTTVKGDKNEKINGTLSRDIDMDLQEKIGSRHALQAGSEIHLKAGMNVVIEAGMSITLKAGGGFIVVGPAGVTLSGIPVLINSGGAPGSGSGCAPDVAKPPLEADTAILGEVSKARPPGTYEKRPPTRKFTNPQAQALAKAAEDGSPLVEIYEKPAKLTPLAAEQAGLVFKESLGGKDGVRGAKSTTPQTDVGSDAAKNGTTSTGNEAEGKSATKIVGEVKEPRTVFSGHGSYDSKNGVMTVPEDSSLTVYSEHGAMITDGLGNRIETGGDLGNVYKKTYGPGEEIPNYTLHPPDDLNITGEPVTVNKDTSLNEILKPGMGECHWAACTTTQLPANSNKAFDVKGVIDMKKDEWIEVYE